MMPVRADLIICTFVTSVSKVWLSCSAINWILILAGLFQVFTNPITNALSLKILCWPICIQLVTSNRYVNERNHYTFCLLLELILIP